MEQIINSNDASIRRLALHDLSDIRLRWWQKWYLTVCTVIPYIGVTNTNEFESKGKTKDKEDY